MRTKSLAMVAVLAATALALSASLVSGPRHVAVADEPAAVDVDVSFFYGWLAPYGDWVPLESYGWVWVPEAPDYGWRPYLVGRWAWTEPWGWTWVSGEPWGWAVYHYGRWLYTAEHGWVWVPGTVWASSWVVFRFGDGWLGWAPMPPPSGWRFDAGLDLGAASTEISVGTYAWTFVPVRHFVEPDLSARVVATIHNPALLAVTTSSARFEASDGSVANRSVDVALVERVRGAPVPRMKLLDAPPSERGGRARVEGDSVILFRPRGAPWARGKPPAPRPRGGAAGPAPAPAASRARRRAALEEHLERQKKALEQDPLPAAPGGPPPAVTSPEETRKRREAAQKSLEEERKRLEEWIERQRRRMERERGGDDGQGHGKEDDGGKGGGMGMGK